VPRYPDDQVDDGSFASVQQHPRKKAAVAKKTKQAPKKPIRQHAKATKVKLKKEGVPKFVGGFKLESKVFLSLVVN